MSNSDRSEEAALVRHPLAWARYSKGWSQDDLAKRLHKAAAKRNQRSGIHRHLISAWETGRKVPSVFSQELLAAVFEVPAVRRTSAEWPMWLTTHDTIPAPGLTGALMAIRAATGAHRDPRGFDAVTPAAITQLVNDWATATEHAHPRAEYGQPEGEQPGRGWLEVRLTDPGTHRDLALLDAHIAAAAGHLDDRSASRDQWPLFAAVAVAARAAAGRCWEVGRRAAAQRYGCAALHAAHQAGRTDLALHTINDLAYMAIRNHDPDLGLHLLHHAAASETRDASRVRHTDPRAQTLAEVLADDGPPEVGEDGVRCLTAP